MSRGWIEDVVAKEHARFREIFGAPAAFQAAPGWTATPLSVEVQEAHGIVATSDTRGGEPFFALRADGAPSKVLEIPTTLPTLDELLALPLRGAGTQREKVCQFLRVKVKEDAAGAGGALHVHSVHTEIEGAASFHDWFAEQIQAWKSDGVSYLTFEEICRPLLSAGTLPVKALSWTTLPGRATPVATGASSAA